MRTFREGTKVPNNHQDCRLKMAAFLFNMNDLPLLEVGVVGQTVFNK